MTTQTRTRDNGRKNGRSTPDLIETLKRGPGCPRKTPNRTALQIADDFEAQAKKLQNAADIFRGKA